MKVIFLTLLFVGLVSANSTRTENNTEKADSNSKKRFFYLPDLTENTLEDKMLEAYEVNKEEGVEYSYLPAFLQNLLQFFNFNKVDDGKCSEEFKDLDPTKIVRLENQQLYYFPDEKLSYYVAKYYCDTRGLQLATFQNLAESVLMAEYLAKLYVTAGATPGGTWGLVWFGLRAVPLGSGTYLWEYSESPLSGFANWRDVAEPTGDDCAFFDVYEVLAATGWSTDALCTDVFNFVCKVPARCNHYLTPNVIEVFDDLK